MASIDLNETKLDKFQNEIKDEKSFEKKINILFQEQYKVNIDDILILKEEMFLDQLREGVHLLLEENYTDNCLSDDRLIKLITDNMDEIQKQYNHDYSLINKAWSAYEKVSKRRTNNEYLLSNFRKHCLYTEDHALHNCCSGGRAKNCHFICVYNADVKKEVKFVICEKCKKVFYSSFIQAYCNKCNKDYYTSLLGPDENPDMLLATWENYHCPQLINEKMKCIKCHENLYINMKNGILTCLNKKCEFVTKPSKIIWTCSLCNSDFKSEAIPYNPLDILRTQKLVEQTILLKHKAHPKKMPCCKLNVFFTDFFHKIECDGLLYEMELNDKIIVVCSKCNAINYYERFKWTCPKCGKRFRDKSSNDNDDINNTNKTDNDNNNTNDIIKDINKKNDESDKANKCYSIGKNRYRNSFYSSNQKNTPKELILNNSGIKDDKDIIKKKESKFVPSSPDISRHRRRFRTRLENELDLGDIKKIIIANDELDDNESKEDSNRRLKRVGFQADEPEQNQESSSPYKKPSRFSIHKKENKEVKDENKDKKKEKEDEEDPLKTIIDNFPDKKENEETDNNKMRKSNTNKNVFSRFKVDQKSENKDDKDKKEENKEKEEDKNVEKNLSPRLMWKRRKQLDNSKKQNVLDLYAVSGNKDEDHKEKKVEKEEKEEKEENKEKDSKQNSGGSSWFKRRQEKREREEKEKKEEKENNEKEEKNVIIHSPVRQYRNKHAKVFACEKEKDEVSQNNDKKEGENYETEDTKETEAKIVFKEEENEEKEEKEEKKEKKEKKIAMSKIPGVSEHLYNHINKRIQKILDRCKIPVFNVEDYMFDRKLGEGGYAIIFAVYKMDDETCKEYAMKKIIARTLNEIDKFTKEFELVYSCDHPNIMKIYGLCIRMLDQTTYSLYVLMEISSGDWDSDIKKHLSKKKSYTEKELICILRQLTDALLFMQQKLKISHRDIKPQNILLFDDGVYKIADFGEAKESKINKDINTLRGTELYMSPALYSGLKNESNDVNHDPYKSDVFSLGFCFIYAAALNFQLLYQLRDVYNSNQMNQILKQQLKKKYSDTFIDILSHMMEIDEALRYDFSHLMEAINTNYDEDGNLKNPDSDKKLDSKRGFRKNK